MSARDNIFPLTFGGTCRHMPTSPSDPVTMQMTTTSNSPERTSAMASSRLSAEEVPTTSAKSAGGSVVTGSHLEAGRREQAMEKEMTRRVEASVSPSCPEADTKTNGQPAPMECKPVGPGMSESIGEECAQSIKKPAGAVVPSPASARVAAARRQEPGVSTCHYRKNSLIRIRSTSENVDLRRGASPNVRSTFLIEWHSKLDAPWITLLYSVQDNRGTRRMGLSLKCVKGSEVAK